MRDGRVGLFVFLALAVTVAVLLARELERRGRDGEEPGRSPAGATGSGTPDVPPELRPQPGIPEGPSPAEEGSLLPGDVETLPVHATQEPAQEPAQEPPAGTPPPSGLETGIAVDPMAPVPPSPPPSEPVPPAPPPFDPAETVSPTPPAPPPPATDTYTVREGDVLSVIAQRVYGRSAAWRHLYEANRDTLASPDDLRPGQVLRTPPLPDAGGGTATPAPAPGPAPSPLPAGARTHRVKEGDSLWSIAQQHYGRANPQILQMLYEANRERMRTPDDLRVGTDLTVPELAN